MTATLAVARSRSRSTTPSSMFATRASVVGRSSRRTSARETETTTSFRRAGLGRDLDRNVVRVDRQHRPEPEPSGRHGHDTGSASRVEQAAAVEPREQLDGGASGRMCARSERAAGIDHDHLLAGRRLDPRRPDPEPAGANRAVELLPAVLPAGRDAVGRDVGERAPELGLALLVGEHDELDAVARRTLLEAVREALEQYCCRDLGLGGRDADCDAPKVAQRSALLSRPKKPSSGFCTYASGPSVRSTSSSRRLCSSSSAVGTATSRRT